MKERMRECSPRSFFLTGTKWDGPACKSQRRGWGGCLSRCEKVSANMFLMSKADGPSHTDVTKALVWLIQYIWTSVQKCIKMEKKLLARKTRQHVTSKDPGALFGLKWTRGEHNVSDSTNIYLNVRVIDWTWHTHTHPHTGVIISENLVHYTI